MSGDETPARLSPHGYVLAVHDLHREAAYYIDQLGFSIEWEDADNWRGLIRDDVRMMLGRCSESIPAAELGDHSYFAFIATPRISRGDPRRSNAAQALERGDLDPAHRLA